jgi:hypothetical protein
MPTNLKNYKEEQRAALMRSLSLAKTTRALVIAYISDAEIRAFIDEATRSIDVILLEDSEINRKWADAFITDSWSLVPKDELMKAVVVPIGPTLGAKEIGLAEFNPMKFEGNAFLFEQADRYQMFAALVRYLENVKYPGDKRTLLKNITGEKS